MYVVSVCPTLDLGLPPDMFCTVDEKCLGVECCLEVSVSYFKKVNTLFYYPCCRGLIYGNLFVEVKDLRLPTAYEKKSLGFNVVSKSLFHTLKR